MSSQARSKRLAWIRWFLFSESLILLLALAGPGYRHAARQDGDHALIARWFFEEPTYLESVLVNFVAVHLFVVGAWFAAWLVARRKRAVALPEKRDE